MSETLENFRTEIADWIAANLPPELQGVAQSEETICWGGRNWQFTSGAQRDWLSRCHARGLTCPRWPTEYGGGGLSRAEEKILREEMDRSGAPSPLQSFGIWMLGPALLKFGTDEQKAAHLPDITAGKIRWCQGYSEPGAGSDLANVQTRAEDMGDHWLVNGSKIWTSYADKADKIFALVRTDREAPKHLGISFMLIDMEAPGVTTKPIRLISGASPFCETFFDNVKVPKEGTIVGEMNRGWDVAKYLLTHEREMIGGGGGGLLAGSTLADLMGTLDPVAAADPFIQTQAMELEVDAMAFALTMERYKDMAEAGQGVGHASAMLKYYGTELNKRRHEIVMSARGTNSLDWEDGAAATWLRTKANSIEGGTSEVMLDIIAKRVLELPSK
ncbi:acyl-CoA dehydrogenase family protein [Alisedimentitalea sp. MJ-SS2]|uniref:acyl-CoA dehydrogenase family protein n=1 Tax=Aliisedimentitalea sp. MJ-SS2 TaxID=3049795 RepID=UPI002910568D|nr:acyl-CoA dehydrogenase family protein [Alisedimentitalea sp. MJ-SS2]MDU8928139.1 acyl-CoA dehydrogenase family protein [Alisedimentitalea sp. MJ-SS2]